MLLMTGVCDLIRCLVVLEKRSTQGCAQVSNLTSSLLESISGLEVVAMTP